MGNDFAQNPVNAENIYKYLKIQIGGKIAEPVFFMQLIGDQDGIQACTDGEKNDTDKKNVTHDLDS